MAKGKKCRICNFYMRAEHEDYQAQGTWVIYVCLNPECPTKKKSGTPEKERVFEQKP